MPPTAHELKAVSGNSGNRTKLAVLGSPIKHSKSPQIHLAAYRALGLAWTYEAKEVTELQLPAFLGSLDDTWLGLSLTMPLKRKVIEYLASASQVVQTVGGANTVRIDSIGLHGTNTDVYGVVAALRHGGIERAAEVLVLGGGATAGSVIAAVAQLGAGTVRVKVRDRSRAGSLEAIAVAFGVKLQFEELTGEVANVPPLVISTLPGGVPVPFHARGLPNEATLLDVAYDPWPSALARSWQERGGAVISGLEMLLHQAIAQIRFFLHADEEIALPDEPELLVLMRNAALESSS